MSRQVSLPRPKAVLIALGLVAGTAVLVGLLHGAAADATAPGPVRDALPVATLTVQREAGYAVEQRFVGRLEPARQTRLAFERAGLVAAVLVEEGDRVAAGQVVARLDDALLRADLDRMEAQRRQAAADLDLARRTLDRQRALAGNGHAAAQRFDEADSTARAAEARLAEVEAGIRAIRIDLEKSALTAPFAGTVGARLIDEGAVVAPGTAVADLLESDRPVARVGIAPDAAAALETSPAQRLVVRGRTVPATLTALRPDLSTATRTVTALFDLPAPVPATFGETVELRLEQRVEDPGLWVPLAALVEGRRGLWNVFAVVDGPDGPTIAREGVEVLHVADGRAFVRGNLADGARIVADGPHRVVPGQPVAVILARAE